MEAFGQTETTMVIGNLVGMKPKIGSMGKPSPLFQVDILNVHGQPAAVGESGEIVIRTQDGVPCGLFNGYLDPEATKEAWHDDIYRRGMAG